MSVRSISRGVILTSRFAELVPEIRLELVGAVREAGQDLVSAAQANLYPGHGYDTGELHDSIHFDDDQEGGGTLYVDAPYAGYVELGTSKMAPIPFVSPALAALPDNLVEHARLRVGAIR